MAFPAAPADSALGQGTLSVVRPAVSEEKGAFETFIKITAEGSVTAFNGHVDLGTGIRTALGQIVAEELDVSFARVVVVLGDTSRVPDQGPTIASETIQITAVPLRKAAAQARHFLIARAVERLELSRDELSVEDGLVRHGRARAWHAPRPCCSPALCRGRRWSFCRHQFDRCGRGFGQPYSRIACGRENRRFRRRCRRA